MEGIEVQETLPERVEKSRKTEKVKTVDKGMVSVLTVVRRCRQEAEQFTAELLALEESDANSKEMDAMFSNILSRFFIRKAKYMRNFDDVPMYFINELGKAIVTKHKQFKMNEFAREMMNIYDQDTGGSRSQPPVIAELAKAMGTTTDKSPVAKKHRVDDEDSKDSNAFQDE